MKSRYFIRSRLTEKKFREIIKLFSSDLTGIQIAHLSGVSRMCVNRILKSSEGEEYLRDVRESLFKRGEIEMDESYFGARRVHGKKGRGA